MMMTRSAAFALFAITIAAFSFAQEEDAPSQIRLMTRADGMGTAQAINEGCIEAYQNGIVRSVGIVVPGPWFLDAVRLLKEHPEVDVCVQLTLTSEWDRMKWRPLTRAPSLIDADGYFHATTSALTGAGPDLKEVERELKAQIETARRHLGNRVTHLCAHVAAATATPELTELVNRLAKQYKLGTEDSVTRTKPIGNPTFASDQREKALIAMLEKLEPGTWLLVENPGYDTPELRALGHKGYENLAMDRSNIRRALTSERAMKVVKKRDIKLIGYKDL